MKPYILVVDDEQLIRDLLMKALSEHGYEVAAVGDGEAALAAIEIRRPDLVLLDLMMPKLDGFDVLRALRASPETVGLQVIVLTARASQEVLQEALTDGADDFISKPFHLGEVVARVRAHIRITEYAQALEHKRNDVLALLDISQRLASRLDLRQILHDVTTLVAERLDTDRCSIVLVEEDGRAGRVVATSDDTGVTDRVIAVDRYPEIERVLQTREPLIIADISADPLFDPVMDHLARLDVRSVALFPLMDGQRCTGVLFLRSVRPLQEFGDRERHFGQIVANATSIAVSNARHFSQIKEESDRASQAKAVVEQRLRLVQKYEDFFENSADGMFITDGAGGIHFMNRQADHMFALPRPLGIGLSFGDLLVEGDRPRFTALIAQARAGDVAGPADVQLGGARDLTLSVSVARLPGETDSYSVTVRDVTAERALARELARTRDFLQNLVDASNDAVVATDLEGNILVFSKAAERLFGVGADKVVGQIHVTHFYPEGGAAETMAMLRADDNGGEGRIFPPVRRDVLDAEGNTLPVMLAASIVKVEGREVATVGLLQDLRDRIKMENRLHQTQEKLLQSERQAMLAELAGTAAHELNQPLTSIMGYAELLKRRIAAEDANHKAADTIQREAQRMADIVRKIGRITKYETKTYVGSARIIDLAASSADGSENT
jgi:PAS domain S-box-containing protein